MLLNGTQNRSQAGSWRVKWKLQWSEGIEMAHKDEMSLCVPGIWGSISSLEDMGSDPRDQNKNLPAGQELSKKHKVQSQMVSSRRFQAMILSHLR